MKILDLFDKYFLALMIIQSGLLIFIDNKSFKRNNMKKETVFSKRIGYGAIIISSALYILRLIFV